MFKKVMILCFLWVYTSQLFANSTTINKDTVANTNKFFSHKKIKTKSFKELDDVLKTSTLKYQPQASEFDEAYIAENFSLDTVTNNQILLAKAVMDDLEATQKHLWDMMRDEARAADEELLAIIGHEVGHCISGHVLYKTLLSLLLRFTTIAASVPLAGLPLMAVISALREWDRKSELSADRAGLLAVQNPETSFHLLMKMAGGPRIEQMSTNEFFKQAAEYEAGGSLIDGLYKLLNLLGQTHPFAVIRLVELKTWVDDGSYGRILGGDYIREEEAGRRTVGEEFSEARKKYEEDIRSSEDPLVGLFRSVGDAATDAANAAGDKAKEIFDTVFGSEKKDR